MIVFLKFLYFLPILFLVFININKFRNACEFCVRPWEEGLVREGACIDFTFHRNEMGTYRTPEGVERQVGKGELDEGVGE